MEDHKKEGTSFDEKKRTYFVKIGLKAREWLTSHRDLGKLWEGREKVEQGWKNVSEHCLVEAARAEVFADVLQLSPQAREELFAAAIIHDFNKREEILETAKEDQTPESFDKVYEIARQRLIVAGVDPNIIETADSVGHASVQNMETILNNTELTEHDVNRLVMHYLDDYTIEAEWVKPARKSETGDWQNDFDRRMDASESNPKYSKIAGEGLYQEQRRVGYLVEKRIAKLLVDKGMAVAPKQIPELIDGKIRERINSLG